MGFWKIESRWMLRYSGRNRILNSMEKCFHWHWSVHGSSWSKAGIFIVEEYPRYNSQTTWSSRRKKTKVWLLRSFWEVVTKYSQGGSMETKRGTALKKRPYRDCPILESIPYTVNKTQALLWIPRSACCQEPDIAVSWEALPEPDKSRGRCLQPTVGLCKGSSKEELENRLKELKGFATT